MMLVRIMTGKIVNKDRAVDNIRTTPIKPDEPEGICVIWVKKALAALQANKTAIRSSRADCNAVKDTAIWCVDQNKAEHRFDGKANYDSSKAPT